jgi:glycosyltransferase involved in cell wall biosynthesis
LIAVEVNPAAAIAIALVTHGVKTLVSFVAVIPAAIWPSPSAFGNLRLPRTTSPVATVPLTPAGDGPVMLVLPAHNEAPRVARVIERLPTSIDGHPTRCVVIDDGSTDATAAEAERAGAEVVRHDQCRGLGAAVRTGFEVAAALDPAAVAFCDADGEYDPAELATVVRPVFDGEAHYVVGSRFSGRIEHMQPHRRFGNRVLTLALRWSTRVPVTDGQSGFRALSATATRSARIVHDYNYAQVLTLDLVAQGFGYVEVPITYRFHESGRSFVKLGQYLTAVLPAWWHALNSESSESAYPTALEGAT